jgi:hypothetical protein
MNPLSVVAAALAWLAVCASAAAQISERPEPRVERIVIQDKDVRIEELRVRGQTQRIIVKPKNAPEYEVVPAAGGRDPSHNRGNQLPGAGGQRGWNLLQF